MLSCCHVPKDKLVVTIHLNLHLHSNVEISLSSDFLNALSFEFQRMRLYSKVPLASTMVWRELLQLGVLMFLRTADC